MYYVGCDLDGAAIKELVRMISKSAGIDAKDAPDGVEVIRKTSPKGDYTVLLNFNETETDVDIKGKSLLDGGGFDGKLAPLSVEIIRERDRKIKKLY